MTTATEIEAQFRAELKALLAKYGAEISLVDHGRDWAPYEHICVDISGTWDTDGNPIREYASFEFGRWIDGTE